MARDLRLFLVGFGVVGQALASLLLTRQEEIKRRIGQGLTVVGVVDSKSSVSDGEGLDLSKVLSIKKAKGSVGDQGTSSAVELLPAVEADIIAELTPAGDSRAEPGLTHMKKALNSGMHVVTSNKMPLALAYTELLKKAKARNLMIKYGACVGAGIPVLEFGDACAVSDHVVRIDGVLNATSNYILTKIEEKGVNFRDALAEAGKAGFAEADPTLDIEGVDAACKIVILANHVLGRDFSLKDVKVMEGIGGVTAPQVESARKRASKIRMVASVEDAPEVRVLELSETDPLAVDGARNAVKFKCKNSGDRVVMGEAAGGATTSTAVLRDILAVGRELGERA